MPPLRLNARGESRSSLARSALSLLAGKALAFLLSVALPLLLVRELTLHDFGVYKQLFLLVGTAVTLLPLGFATSAYYFVPRTPERGPAVALNILLIHALIGGLAWCALTFAPGFLDVLFHGSGLVEYAPLTAWIVLLWVVSSALEPIVVGNQEPRLAATFIAGAQLVKTLLAVLAVLFLPGLQALLYAAIVYGLAHVALLLGYLAWSFGRRWLQLDWTVMRAQLSYALPHGFAVLLWFLQSDLHQYVVASRFDTGLYALYAIGCFQIPLVGMLNESVSSVLIPRVSRLQLEGRGREILTLTIGMVTRLSFALLPLYVFLLVTGREFIAVVFTERYADSWPIFAVNLTLLPLGLVGTACDPVIRAYAEERYFLIRVRMALSVVLVFALLAFVKGPLGPVVAISTVIAVQAAERLLIAQRVLQVLQPHRADLSLLRDFGKIALAGLGAGAGAALCRRLVVGYSPMVALASCGAVFAVLYVSLLAVLGIAVWRSWIGSESPGGMPVMPTMNVQKLGLP